jgi:hypothetical protein
MSQRRVLSLMPFHAFADLQISTYSGSILIVDRAVKTPSGYVSVACNRTGDFALAWNRRYGLRRSL